MLREAILQMGKPPGDLTTRGSFEEIQGVEDYTGERCDLASLDVASLSLPPAGFMPQDLSKLLGVEAPVVIQKVITESLLPKELFARKLEECGLRRPYSDPKLKSKRERVKLLRRLLASNMIDFSKEDG
eukprot:10566449-Karenia_brevis.AAC.1